MKRIDKNQHEIVNALKQIGATVLLLSNVGKGCPDICVGFRGRNYLLEIKNGSKLTPDQNNFHSIWRGQLSIVHTINDALTIVSKISESRLGSDIC